MTPFTVLHVCTGNICRSPMAERLLARRVAAAYGADAGSFRDQVRLRVEKMLQQMDELL